jgi:serine/threonine protein kinase
MRALLSRFPQKFGSYVLLAPLGEGGMGAVYLAMSGHREMETLCVVKRMLPVLLSQPEHVRRFRHEADLARQLVHSNLAHTHNIGEVDGEVFLVQELVEGHDVSALLDRMAAQGRTLPVPVAIYIVSEIARGLAYAHEFENLNLVHRDINPPNVRLTYAGEVKLLDFGIASSDLHGEPSAEHRAAGKLWHLAPEQLRPGAKLDRRTDIYALGVLLWELLTQRPIGTTVDATSHPSSAPETEGEILVWISRGEHALPSVFNPEVPADLDAVVRRATSANPDERFATADDFRRALAGFVPPEVHPEIWLSMALKEIFSPDKERAERRRLIEAGRHLLDVGPERRALGGGANLARTPSASVQVPRRHGWRWMMPMGVGALAGMAMLFWLRMAADRADDGGSNAPTVAPPSQPASATPTGTAKAKPIPEAPAPGADFPATAPPPQAPLAAVPATSSAKSAGPKTRSSAPANRPGESASAKKIDHLGLAREAFNTRDWARALDEGKRAVAAGGGAEARAVVGNTLFKMGKFPEAEAEYQKALALDPGNALLRDRLSIAHVRAQNAPSSAEAKAAKEP